MQTERLTPAERAEAALGAVVLQAEADILAGKEGAEATFQAAYRQWARRRSAGLSPAARVGAALGALFGAMVGDLTAPAAPPRDPSRPRKVNPRLRLGEDTPTLDDVRTPAGQVGTRPSEARLEERLRVLTYLRAQRRGTLAGLVAACEIPESMARRHLMALQRLGHVKTDLVTWEVADFAAARGAS